MGNTAILSKILDFNHIDYYSLENSISDDEEKSWVTNSITINNLANIAILETESSIIIALYPASHHINLAKVIKIFSSTVIYSTTDKIKKILQESDEFNLIEFINSYNFQIIVDLGISDFDEILFKNNNKFLCINSDNLQKLILQEPIGCQFTEPRPEFIYQPNLTIGAPRLDLKDKLDNIQSLPILPDIAAQILELQSNSNATVDSLSKIILQDPSLTAVILKYANSALFGQRGAVDSIYDAILRILGFDTVMYLAIGLAMGNSFKLDKNGPIGANQLWQHAVFSAALTQKLSQKMPANIRPIQGKAYLAGLLHDIGYLVLAHSFETEYFWLNKIIASKPDVPITVIEHQLLGIHHTTLGQVLMQKWNMPDFLQVTVSEHHNEDYDGEHCELTGLILLVDRALKLKDSSDAFTDSLPEELICKLGLSTQVIDDCINEVFECCDSLKIMVAAISR